MLGARIAALRRKAGMSQAQLGEALQVSPSTVGMYEQGRREPAAQTLVKLAEIFQVSTDFLLTGKARVETEQGAVRELLLQSLEGAQQQLKNRGKPPFSRQELAVLIAAMLTEP